MSISSERGQPAPVPASADDVASRSWRDELASLLELQRAQVLALGEDCELQLGDLAGAFEVMSGAIRRHGPAPAAGELRESLNAAATTLQFADAQAQRLDHLARALAHMASRLRGTDPADAAGWQALRAEMRAAYTMARETEVFDRLFGPSGEDAGSGHGGSDQDPAIELF